jgi:hypothetical protein
MQIAPLSAGKGPAQHAFRFAPLLFHVVSLGPCHEQHSHPGFTSCIQGRSTSSLCILSDGIEAVNPTRYLQTALNKFPICRRQFKSTRATVVVADLSHIVGKTASEPRMCNQQGSLQQTSYTTAQHTPRPYQGTDYYLGTSSIVSNIRNARTFSTIHSCVPV